MEFDNGPNVHLHINIQNGVIHSSRLSLSSKFSCSGANQTILEWLEHYARGLILPLHLVEGSSFQQKVLQTLQTIPFAETISYKNLATLVGSPHGARAAGNACNRNPFPLLIPCHRVIQSDGRIGGFALDLEIKKRLLSFEASRRGSPQHISI